MYVEPSHFTANLSSHRVTLHPHTRTVSPLRPRITTTYSYVRSWAKIGPPGCPKLLNRSSLMQRFSTRARHLSFRTAPATRPLQAHPGSLAPRPSAPFPSRTPPPPHPAAPPSRTPLHGHPSPPSLTFLFFFLFHFALLRPSPSSASPFPTTHHHFHNV